MNILLVSNMYPSYQKPYSGVYVKNLVDELKKESVLDVTLLKMRRSYTSKLGSSLKYFKFFFLSIAHLFKRFDILHLHFFYPLVLWVWFYKMLHPKSKVVVTFHGSDINSHFNSPLSKQVGRYLAQCVDSFIAVGDELKLAAEEKLGIKVEHVIPAGVNTNVFYPGEKRKQQYDFIFVGSFIKLKGVDAYIEALRRFDNELNLCFVGSGPLLDDIESLKEAHRVDVFQNLAQTEIVKLYQASKFLVLPSRSEAFGLVVSEAMYCGTPALVSNVGGLPMQVSEGKNGFFFSDVNATAIFDLISFAYEIDSSSYASLKSKALQSNKQFSLDNVIKQNIMIYRDLVNEP